MNPVPSMVTCCPGVNPDDGVTVIDGPAAEALEPPSVAMAASTARMNAKRAVRPTRGRPLVELMER